MNNLFLLLMPMIMEIFQRAVISQYEFLEVIQVGINKSEILMEILKKP